MTKTEDPTVCEPVTVVMIPRERFGCARESLESLHASTEVPFKLIYVDTKSPEPYASELRELATEYGFQLLRCDSFVKPTCARNAGARLADTQYVAFVDNDVAFAPGWLEKLVECAEATGAEVVGPLACQFEPLHEEIHAAGGQIMDPGEHERFLAKWRDEEPGSTDVDKLRLHEVIFKQGLAVADERPNLRRQETGFVEFHCCLVRRDALVRIGFLDENLSTKEHLDFCLSIQKEGGKVFFEPESVITYFAAAGDRRLHWAELRYYLRRWSETWHRTSLRHFMSKWGFLDDGYVARKMRISASRRRKAIERMVRQTMPLLRGFPARALVRATGPFERVANRLLIRRGSGEPSFQVVDGTVRAAS